MHQIHWNNLYYKSKILYLSNVSILIPGLLPALIGVALSFTINLDKSIPPGWTVNADSLAKYISWNPELSVLTTYTP